MTIKKIAKQSAILIAILLLANQASFIALPALGAGIASLSLGEATLRKGCPGSIPIYLDTHSETVYAADVAMTVSGNSIVDSLAAGSILPMQTCSDSSVPGIMLCGARQPGSGAFVGQGVYGTINITPNATGILGINFDTSSSSIINFDIQNVLGAVTGATYNVDDRFNVEVDGTGFCSPDTTNPNISVNPSNGQNNVPISTSITLSLSDDRVGVDLSTLAFSVNGKAIDTFSYTKTGGTYTPSTPFELGEQVSVEARVCDMEYNCKNYSGNFRTTPPPPGPNCGNKTVDIGEECDAGYQTASCDRDCTLVECGDGIINDMAGEQCDDFNLYGGDGCTYTCTLEAPIDNLIYCPVIIEVKVPTRPAAEELEEGEGDEDEDVDEERDEDEDEEEVLLQEKDFDEADFAEAASATISEVALREAAKPVSITPSTPEKKEKLDPCILKYGSEGASLDHDGDGLSDRMECYSETDPNNADTDGDTCFDGEEINRFYTDPLVADCSISDYVEEDVLINDPKPNWILTSIEVSGTTPRRSLTVGITAFPAIQKPFSKVLTQYQKFLNVLNRDVDPANLVAIQQKTSDTTDSITELRTYIKDTQEFIDNNSEDNEELAFEIKRVTTFLNGGTAAVSNEVKQAEARFEALKKFQTQSIFLGEVNELQIVRVGETTTNGFKLEPKVELEDGTYDLVATASFADGGTKSSAPVQIQLSSGYKVEVPYPQTLDGIPVGVEKIVTKNQRPILSGRSVYGAMVFATWESLVLESSIIADSTEGNFDVQPPRNLEAGDEHTVTMYAVTEVNGNLIRSKSRSVDFIVEKSIELSIVSTAIYIIIILTLLALLAFAVDNGKKKRREEKERERAKERARGRAKERAREKKSGK